MTTTTPSSLNIIQNRVTTSTLKPFETATRQLALASLPTISKVLPVVTGLLTSLEPSSFAPQTIQKLKDTLRSALKVRVL
ncbi:unnamed protein product [Didymodactylos carnosus]|uniref:Uncharacterized protein n=2 Tax=Didymodactylos carnosus TaxID=1234261 RepID=A0A815CDC1_9BILA|nr:unnamed protein product [Didymodactylos carnosus]CAF4076905.1 unnamed protein product [Didymodactylos carnosus]